MKKTEPMIIYNIFPLLAGTYIEWESHLKRAAEMGFTWIFVNPIQRPGQSGSLYSIADYYGFNPLMVDAHSSKKPAQQVKAMIAAADKLGLKVMIDFVINHCAVDSDLLTSHPQWFEWDSPGNVAHPWADDNGNKVVWHDLAKFNYKHTSDQEGLYRYFFDLAAHLIDLGFQGFRCDAAYQVPGNVWQRLIKETKAKHPQVRFLAETLGCPPDLTTQTARAGFDYIFNSSKWWDFNSPWLLEQYNLTRETVPSISFPESHDTQRLCDELNNNIDGIKQRYLFTSLFSAGSMMPIGFEFGFRKRFSVVQTRPGDWEQTGIDLRQFITNVNTLKAGHALLQEDGPLHLIPHNNQNILILWKASSRTQEEMVLILNKDTHTKQHFYEENPYHLVQAGGLPLVDVSPEYALDHIPIPFVYDLRPGQGIVLITSRRSERKE
jgi:starch synthase (maltosyl-transferring)